MAAGAAELAACAARNGWDDTISGDGMETTWRRGGVLVVAAWTTSGQVRSAFRTMPGVRGFHRGGAGDVRAWLTEPRSS